MAFLIIAALIVGVVLVIAKMRKGSAALESKPSRLKSFSTSLTPSEAFKVAIRWASASAYKIDDVDEARLKFVLSDSATATSWGFFYPIFVSAGGERGAVVEVGIKSKALQYGPLVSRAHEKCFSAIKTALIVAHTD